LMWSIDAVQAVVVVSDPLISNNGVIVLPMTKVRNSERITHNYNFLWASSGSPGSH
jgi:uncharacterized protein YifN (PemK superfamily)